MTNDFQFPPPKDHSFLESLHTLLEESREEGNIEVREIFTVLAGKGYAALLIVFSLPFCIPVNIPGFSTPFGFILAFIGFRIAFAKHYWWPEWILNKKISPDHLRKVVVKIIPVFKAIQKVLRPRLTFLVHHVLFHRTNGLLVILLGLLLAIPLPIPLTNTIAVLPIVCFGLALLEDDGFLVLLGYVLTGFAFGVYTLIFLLGKSQIMRFFQGS